MIGRHGEDFNMHRPTHCDLTHDLLSLPVSGISVSGQEGRRRNARISPGFTVLGGFVGAELPSRTQARGCGQWSGQFKRSCTAIPSPCQLAAWLVPSTYPTNERGERSCN